MSRTRDMVREFHQAFEVVDAKRPCVPEPAVEHSFTLSRAIEFLRASCDQFRMCAQYDVRALRLALIAEELAELADASVARDATQALDALCDLQYVLDGTVLAFGMNDVADEAYRRVHASNMSKLGADGRPVKNDTGKIIKGPNFVPVKLEDLVSG